MFAERFESGEALETEKIPATDIPEQLKHLSEEAVCILAYVVSKKVSGEATIKGHEIVTTLKKDAGMAPLFLQALDELERSQWLELTPDNDSKMKQRPWCWLQAQVEFGSLLIQNDCGLENNKTGFSSNGDYIDCVISYVKRLAERFSDNGVTICSEDTHAIPEWQPDKEFKEICERVMLTSVPLPAYTVREKFGLSWWQYFYLMGMLGYGEKVIRYDFSDINDVVKLFASNFNIRRMMREHLTGGDTPLIKSGLIEIKEGGVWDSSSPTAKAYRIITGARIKGKSLQEVRRFVTKETIFDFDAPKIRAASLMLPMETMETIRGIIHAEKPAGKRMRKELHKNFPSGGCPTGTTVLLYGAPGTGKTLTASYIASELNVPLLKVDSSKVVGKYVGENEKNTVRIFDDYAEIYAMTGKRPVLLINEADQLLHKRIEPTGSAAQADNNMQNLFLDALERFDGILVATTNCRELLDDAYSRRFTFKMELMPPDMTVRQKLWETYLPKTLLDGNVDFGKLSSYPLTGGEIRLVLEQAVRKAALKGCSKLDGGMIVELAGKEADVNNSRQINRIGFGV